MLMFLSYLKTDKHFILLNLKIWILVTENCLEIEDVLKFESLEGHILLARAALKITKIQIFRFRKIKCSSVWRYDKNISTLIQKSVIYKQNGHFMSRSTSIMKAFLSKPNYFFHFFHHFYLPEVNVQIQNFHGVLGRLFFTHLRHRTSLKSNPWQFWTRVFTLGR